MFGLRVCSGALGYGDWSLLPFGGHDLTHLVSFTGKQVPT